MVWEGARHAIYIYTMNVMCSETVNAPLNKSSWCTKPLNRCINGPIGRLFTRISPLTVVPAGLRWANADISVLLPAPLEFTTQTIFHEITPNRNHIKFIVSRNALLYLAPITANNTPGLTYPVELFMIRLVCFFLRINLFAFASALANTDTFRQINFAPRLLIDDDAVGLLQSVSSKLLFFILAERSEWTAIFIYWERLDRMRR